MNNELILRTNLDHLIGNEFFLFLVHNNRRKFDWHTQSKKFQLENRSHKIDQQIIDYIG